MLQMNTVQSLGVLIYSTLDLSARPDSVFCNSYIDISEISTQPAAHLFLHFFAQPLLQTTLKPHL